MSETHAIFSSSGERIDKKFLGWTISVGRKPDYSLDMRILVFGPTSNG